MKISKSKLVTSRVSLLLFYWLYFCIFQFVYQNWIVPVFGYDGYEGNFNLIYFFFSLGAIGCLVIYAKNDLLPSSFFVHLILAIIFVPSAVLFAGQGKGLNFIVTTFFSIILIIFILKLIRFKMFKVRDLNINEVVNILALITGLSLLAIIFFSGFAYLNFDFSRVYELRREAEEDLPGIFGYINSATTKIFIPFGLILAAIQRRWLIVGLFILSSILFFGFTQHKSPIFTPVLVAFIYFLAKSQRLKLYFVISMISIVVLGAADLWWMELNRSSNISGWFASLFVRRSLLVPSLLNYDYIDFFIDKEKYYWAASKLSFGLVGSPYDINAPQLIGYTYFNGNEMFANAGWIGSGFANAGYIGVVVYSFIIGLIFSMFDGYAKKIGSRIVIALFLIPVFTLVSSSDLATVFVSHGLLYGLMILVFIRPDKDISRGKFSQIMETN